ncbi:hypothetical protein L0Y26_03580 [Pectobacterium aroidearum]|uniref:hypothetical protein n=1 Tax=Pectobacterium aroidearum TaxID=1201031 RepID=UPI002114B5E8|nr:hypothetical protein [Pectobacterium aroidearum]UUE37046.1 hypothetical protein L0Y26_03580 [Pectobacterium aroidearum]UUE41423.1 hypothetical protein L0Y25_03575 [Pectobacterium aroidearum]
MTDKKELLATSLFMLFWMYGLHTLFDPFSGPAFLFQEIASLGEENIEQGKSANE